MDSDKNTFLNENGEIILSKDIRDIADLKVGEKIVITYDEDKDVLVLCPVKNVTQIKKNGFIQIPKEILDEMSLCEKCEFEVSYDEEGDSIILKAISEICAMCKVNQATFNVGDNDYVCEDCLRTTAARTLSRERNPNAPIRLD